MWDIETIPDGDFVFMRAHKSFIKDGELIPGVFQNRGEGMSTDWEKYSTAEQTRNRTLRSPPGDNGVIKLSVAGIRNIEKLSVVHEPLPDNRAHTEVFGEKTTKARMLLLREVNWAIMPPDQSQIPH
jgi:hypothetical protein